MLRLNNYFLLVVASGLIIVIGIILVVFLVGHQPTKTQPVSLASGQANYRLTLIDKENRPIPHIKVTLRKIEDGKDQQSLRGIESKDDGKAFFAGLTPGNYEVTFFDPQGQPIAYGDTEMIIRLRGGEAKEDQIVLINGTKTTP